MAKAYWVVCYRSITNPDQLPGYQEALRVLGDAAERDQVPDPQMRMVSFRPARR